MLLKSPLEEMMTSRLRHFWLLPLAALLFLTSCAAQSGPLPAGADLSTSVVNLYLTDYTPQISAARWAYYADKKICLSNITNEAAETTTFFYFSRDRQVRYTPAPKANLPIQPIPSFLWYAYQKAFQAVGIEAVFGCAPGMTEIWITVQSLDDEGIRLKVVALKNAKMIDERQIDLPRGPASDRHPPELARRAYDMIDLTVTAILDDPGIKEILLRKD